jgi:hypothetical protein
VGLPLKPWQLLIPHDPETLGYTQKVSNFEKKKKKEEKKNNERRASKGMKILSF